MNQYDIIVVGAGISGATIAERYASQQNKKVLVVEKRSHIGGNCYDFTNSQGIRIGKYGAHIFHTNNRTVWNYVNKFSKWYRYEHTVLSYVDKNFVPIPVNITTVNTLFQQNITSSKEFSTWLQEEQTPLSPITNSEEVALSQFGPRLYEKMFKNYTSKQWDTDPKNLSSEVMARIPIRKNFDTRYFSDIYQALPTKGYTALFENMLDHPNIRVLTNTDFFSIQNSLKGYEKLFFTGRIDQFFPDDLPPLGYRSLRFESQHLAMNYYQPSAVVNYPQAKDFTRIVEYKHFMKNQPKETTIVKEFPTWEGEPYYPIPNEKNKKLFSQYQKLARKKEKEGIYFVGRLANYKYFNMDQAFKNALDLYTKLHP